MTLLHERHEEPPIQWSREFTWGGDSLAYRVGQSGDLLVAEWVGIGVLRCTLDGRTHEFRAHAGAVEREERRIAQAVVPSLLRHLRGEIALHASAVVVDDRAVAFLGPSGAGKSTMAATMCEEEGVAFAADDVAFVDSHRGCPYVVPTEDVHRLFAAPNQVSKTWTLARRVATAPASLLALVAIVTDSAAAVSKLSRLEGAAAFAAANAAFVRFVTGDAARNARDFKTVADLVSRVSVFELRRPADLQALPIAARLIRNQLGVMGRSGGKTLP
jgi:hypothetical protein